MVSVFTPNIQLEEPARGDDVGTWDTPVNANMTLLDLVVGGTATIPVAGAGIVLAAAQYQSKTIVLNSTLTASIIITFPTSFSKSYEILNQTTGSSNFTITLKTTAAGATAICVPPGETIDVMNTNASFYYKGLGRIGTYWDYAGSSVPNWVSGCTVPPYLNCDATTFSSATYPALTTILGSTTLPDSRGRVRAALNQTTGLLNSSLSVDGNTRGAIGGSQLMQSHTHANTLTDPGHIHTTNANSGLTTTGGGGFGAGGTTGSTISNATTGISINNIAFGGGGGQNVQPTYMGGLTLIRAG